MEKYSAAASYATFANNHFEQVQSATRLQVRNAEQRGAIGVILFSDPQDYAKRGRDRVYPQNLDLPGMGVQSGSSVIHRGDPLTPGIPATGNILNTSVQSVNLIRLKSLRGRISFGSESSQLAPDSCPADRIR